MTKLLGRKSTRRKVLKLAGSGILAASVPALSVIVKSRAAEKLMVFRGFGLPTIAPPDWSSFKAETGMDMEYVDLSGGYLGAFMQEVEVNKRGDTTDALFFEGGTQIKLGPEGAYLRLDTSKMPLWARTPDSLKLGELYQSRDG